MVKQSASHFELFLTKQGQNNLKKHEMIAFVQLLRIINSLRFQMGLLLHTKDEKDKLFQLRAQVEIYAVMASLFKEATKVFFNKLFKVLDPLSDKKQLKKTLNEYDVRTRDYKNDEVLQIIDYIRNNFSFHMKSELFEGFIVEGNAKKDMLIGIAKSEKIIDSCFVTAYDALIFQAGRMAKSLEDKSKILDWLFDNILREADYFCGLLEKLGGSIIKKYGGKRLITN
jgi:hypothetical protein